MINNRIYQIDGFNYHRLQDISRIYKINFQKLFRNIKYKGYYLHGNKKVVIFK